MTFLEPILLWGLPLALLPVLIHLFNRLRHRSMDWAAMMFLLSANKKSTRYAKLRQWLVLLFRVLAVLALIVSISRPLAGGWIGWMFRPAPDVILLVVDRSGSMESKLIGGQSTKREEALRLLADTARGFQESCRLVLIDSALCIPQEVADAKSLSKLSLTAATDTAADLPTAIQASLEWLQRNRPGSAEIWIASDLQRSNWEPDSGRWLALATQLAALPQGVRVRLLALNKPSPTENNSISILDVNSRLRAEPPELEISFNVERGNPNPATLPVDITIDGNRTHLELAAQGQSYRYRYKAALENAAASGWGKVELPADGNLRDNAAYFVYSPPPVLRTAVVATNAAAGRFLQLASAPTVRDTNRISELLALDKLNTVTWSDYALVLWQAPLPQGETAKQLRSYVESGGILICFPSGDEGRFGEVAWKETQTAEPDKAWKIARWNEKEGPLAKTEEGLSLPLNELSIQRRQVLTGLRDVLASFEDGSPFVARQVVGKGQVVFCASAPLPEWSNLHDGIVLVPLVQRSLQTGGRRLTQGNMLVSGETSLMNNASAWTPVEGGTKDIRTQAGVYRLGGRLVAVNHPQREEEIEVLEPAQARALFGKVPVQWFEDKGEGDSKLQSELWRTFLFLMVLALLIEAILILPPKPVEVSEKGGS